jgi:hypothetical protein
MFETPGHLVPTLDVAAILRELPGAPAPKTVVWAELDGNLIWSPVPVRDDAAEPIDLSPDRADPLDSSQYPGLPALLDRHTLEIRTRVVQQLWLLERTGSGYSARLMMHNP